MISLLLQNQQKKLYSDFVKNNGTDHSIGNLQKVELERICMSKENCAVYQLKKSILKMNQRREYTEKSVYNDVIFAL